MGISVVAYIWGGWSTTWAELCNFRAFTNKLINLIHVIPPDNTKDFVAFIRTLNYDKIGNTYEST